MLHRCTDFESVSDNKEEDRNSPQEMKLIDSVLGSLGCGRGIKNVDGEIQEYALSLRKDISFHML